LIFFQRKPDKRKTSRARII